MKNLIKCCTIFCDLPMTTQNLVVDIARGGDFRRLDAIALTDLVAARDFMITITFQSDFSHDLWREASYLLNILQALINKRKPNES